MQYRVAQPGKVLPAGGRVLNLVDLGDVYVTSSSPQSRPGGSPTGRRCASSWTRRRNTSSPPPSLSSRASPSSRREASRRRRSGRSTCSGLRRASRPSYCAAASPRRRRHPGIAYVRLVRDAAWPSSVTETLVQPAGRGRWSRRPSRGCGRSALSDGKARALDAVTLDIPRGRMVGLIGPDGVGKSNMLSLVADAQSIQTGQVEVLGGDMANAADRARTLPADRLHAAAPGEESQSDAVGLRDHGLLRPSGSTRRMHTPWPRRRLAQTASSSSTPTRCRAVGRSRGTGPC